MKWQIIKYCLKWTWQGIKKIYNCVTCFSKEIVGFSNLIVIFSTAVVISAFWYYRSGEIYDIITDTEKVSFTSVGGLEFKEDNKSLSNSVKEETFDLTQSNDIQVLGIDEKR